MVLWLPSSAAHSLASCGSVLCIVHSGCEQLRSICSQAHHIMESVIHDTHSVVYDHSCVEGPSKSATLSRYSYLQSSDGRLLVSLASCNGVVGLGFATNKKYRLQAAKLSLAIASAILRGREAVPGLEQVAHLLQAARTRELSRNEADCRPAPGCVHEEDRHRMKTTSVLGLGAPTLDVSVGGGAAAPPSPDALREHRGLQSPLSCSREENPWAQMTDEPHETACPVPSVCSPPAHATACPPPSICPPLAPLQERPTTQGEGSPRAEGRPGRSCAAAAPAEACGLPWSLLWLQAGAARPPPPSPPPPASEHAPLPASGRAPEGGGRSSSSPSSAPGSARGAEPAGEARAASADAGGDAAGDAGVELRGLDVWCPTAFQLADRADEDPTIIFHEGSQIEGPFVAFGDVVCSERYILWQAHICNREFRRAPVDFKKFWEFPHMTLAKLEIGSAERRANRSTWIVDLEDGPETYDLADLLRDLNELLGRDTTVYRLHAGHLSADYWGLRYNISGGPAHVAFRRVQAILRDRLALLGDRVSFWADEPALPHVTFEYPERVEVTEASELPRACEAAEEESADTFSKHSSLDEMLDRLDKLQLGRFKPLFKRERLSMSVLPLLGHQELKDAGVLKLGDRTKLMELGREIFGSAGA
ncbi:unnamed protein product [Prorocentrum cordatum]|uniref:SAM domain-containing protein n=1 Tax=Prorocentrum cordatum TaxID=2364126 RepID=A0ABN9Y7Q1_9DINO|nr:unnamed protein product [Polarella glacialis]